MSLITAAGSSIVLVALITGVFKMVTGRSAREREDNASAEVQRMQAVEDRDAANKRSVASARNTLRAYEYVSRLRRQILDLGHEPLEDPHPPTSES